MMTIPEEYIHLRRETTREEEIALKKDRSITYPLGIACVHLMCDGNLGFIVRAAACFGAEEVLVIGSSPEYKELRKKSCGTNRHTKIKLFSSPSEFLEYVRNAGYHLVSLELSERSVPLFDYKFPLDRRVCIITGNESFGVPEEVMYNSDCIYIPNPGFAKCMNTSQAANVALYEYVRQVMNGC